VRKARTLLSVIICCLLALLVYTFMISKELQKVVSSDEVVTRTVFSIVPEAPVFSLSVNDSGTLLVEKCTSSNGWDYKWRKNEKTISIGWPCLVDLEGSQVVLQNGSDSFVSKDQLTSMLTDINANPQDFSIKVTDSAIESDDLRSVYYVEGDLSGKLVTYASHGDKRMKMPVEWTDIEKVTRPNLFNGKGVVISAACGIGLWIILYFVIFPISDRKKHVD